MYYRQVLKIIDEINDMQEAQVPAKYMLMHFKELQKALKQLQKYQRTIKRNSNLDLTIKIQSYINAT
jgi:hypothetical protein